MISDSFGVKTRVVVVLRGSEMRYLQARGPTSCNNKCEAFVRPLGRCKTMLNSVIKHSNSPSSFQNVPRESDMRGTASLQTLGACRYRQSTMILTIGTCRSSVMFQALVYL
jgi:hypothetical protein